MTDEETSAPPMPSDDSRRAAGPPPALRWSEIIFFAAVVLGCLATLWLAAQRIRLPFAVNFEEGNVLNAALRITRGGTPYPPVGNPPYVVSPYGPVFYYAAAPLVKWFGVNFTAPRLLVLASGILAALFLVLLLGRWTGSRRVAVAFGLLFLALPLVRGWIFVLRVDLFALALTLAGLYVFCLSRRPVWPALLFLAAIYAKITMLAAPVACWLYLLRAGERRRAWSLAGWMAAIGLAAFGALEYATHGWLAFHLFLTHPDPYLLSRYARIILPYALLDVVLLIAAAALAVRDFRRRALSLPLLYFLLASIATLTAGKIGSDANHLLEWQAAMCLAAGCGYQAMRARPRPEPALALIPVGLTLVVLFAIPHSARLDPEMAGCADAYQFARQHPGPLLSENPGAAVLSGKKVWLSNSFEYDGLGKAGRLDQQPLIRLVQQRFFSTILLSGKPTDLQRRAADTRSLEEFWPASFAAAVAQNYHPAARFACAYANVAYEPNATPDQDSLPSLRSGAH
jgi:hypothetical protein